MSKDCSFRASDGSSRLIRGSFVLEGRTLTVRHAKGRTRSVLFDEDVITPEFAARTVLAEIDREERT